MNVLCWQRRCVSCICLCKSSCTEEPGELQTSKESSLPFPQPHAVKHLSLGSTHHDHQTRGVGPNRLPSFPGDASCSRAQQPTWDADQRWEVLERSPSAQGTSTSQVPSPGLNKPHPGAKDLLALSRDMGSTTRETEKRLPATFPWPLRSRAPTLGGIARQPACSLLVHRLYGT